MAILHVNDASFTQEILNSSGLTVVDFWAPWCGPCQMIAPALEALDQEYSDKIRIAKVNVDESHKVATQYGIMAIPTIVFFKNGEIVDQATGVLSKQQLKKKVEENLK